jgi:tRNA(fMet)-specific endonuclease VapC
VVVRILLDTNAYSALKRGHARVAYRVRRAEAIVFSAIVAGELLYGFRHGDRYRRNLEELESFLAHPLVGTAGVTLSTAHRFGIVAAALRRKGRPLPTNDVWIAAQALDTGAELLTFDRHFGHVDGLLWTHPDD